MIGAVFDSKQKTEEKISKDLTMTEEQIRKEREFHTKEIGEAMDYCLTILGDPALDTKLMQLMTNGKEYLLVHHVAGMNTSSILN